MSPVDRTADLILALGALGAHLRGIEPSFFDHVQALPDDRIRHAIEDAAEIAMDLRDVDRLTVEESAALMNASIQMIGLLAQRLPE